MFFCTGGNYFPVLNCFLSPERPLNRFVRHYEPLSYEPIIVNPSQSRRKRSLEQEHGRVKFTIQSRNRRFHLSLTKDTSVFSENFVLMTSQGPVQANLDHLYSGYLVGVKNSRVVGSIVSGLFSGRIVTPDNEYYVERASSYFRNASDFHSILYASGDVVFAGAACGLHGAAEAWVDGIRHRYGRHRHQRSKRSVQEPVKIREGVDVSRVNGTCEPRHAPAAPAEMEGRKRSAQPLRSNLKRVCNLEIIIDHTLYEAKLTEHFEDSKAKQALMDLVHSHVSSARDIYKHTDFNGIKDISFEVQRTHINGKAACTEGARHSNPFCSNNLDATHALHELSKLNHDDFCLTYLWTNRDFPGGTLGLAYMAEPEGEPAGVAAIASLLKGP
ncbi:unnamed protein product [Ixodes hexagonus]